MFWLTWSIGFATALALLFIIGMFVLVIRDYRQMKRRESIPHYRRSAPVVR